MDKGFWTAVQPLLAQGARDFLRTVGTALAAHGYITNGGAGVEAFIGAGMTIAGLFWGWWTTSGYIQVGGLLKKLTATHTASAAVEVAKVMPAASQTGAAEQAKSIATAAGVIKVLLVAFLLTSLVPLAHAQTGNIIKDITARRVAVVKPTVAASSTSTDPLSKLMSDLANVQAELVSGIISDITAADLDAGTIVTPAIAATDTTPAMPAVVKDPISHACYPAEIQFLQSLPVATPTTGTYFLVQLFQKKRDFVAQIQSGLPVYLKLGCAPLLGDEVSILTKSLGLIGVNVAANMLLPGIGAALPVLP